jgi:hypothetical protein
MKLTEFPVKEVIAIGAVAVTLTGFYFSTGFRLDVLEETSDSNHLVVNDNVQQIRELREDSIELSARLKRIDEKLDDVRIKIERLEETVLQRVSKEK